MTFLSENERMRLYVHSYI